MDDDWTVVTAMMVLCRLYYYEKYHSHYTRRMTRDQCLIRRWQDGAGYETGCLAFGSLAFGHDKEGIFITIKEDAEYKFTLEEP